jgi:hypothetical protein
MSKDMPGHARYRHANEGCTSNMDEAAELGWNHESIQHSSLCRDGCFLRSFAKFRNSNRLSIHEIHGQRLNLQEE